MVQVVPPVDWKRPGSGDSFPGDLAAVLPAESKPAARTSEPSLKKAAAAVAAVPPALPLRPEPQPSTAAMPASPEIGPSLSSTVAAWARQEWLLLSSGLAGGIMLGAAVWFVVAIQSNTPVVVLEQAVADESPVDSANTEPAFSLTAAAPAAKTSQAASAAEPADTPQDEPQGVADTTPPAASDAVKSAAPAASEHAGQQLSQPTPAETAEDTAPPEPGPSLRLEPIRPNSTLPDLTAAVASAGNTSPEELVPLDPEPAGEAAGSPEADSPGKPAPLSREQIDERLAVSLESVEFADVPLAQFAAFIGDVSGVPVTLDEAALAKAGQGRKTPISVKHKETTAGEALRAAVQRAGLSIAFRDGRIVISAPL
jgi:hypothetical protein